MRHNNVISDHSKSTGIPLIDNGTPDLRRHMCKVKLVFGEVVLQACRRGEERRGPGHTLYRYQSCRGVC